MITIISKKFRADLQLNSRRKGSLVILRESMKELIMGKINLREDKLAEVVDLAEEEVEAEVNNSDLSLVID